MKFHVLYFFYNLQKYKKSDYYVLIINMVRKRYFDFLGVVQGFGRQAIRYKSSFLYFTLHHIPHINGIVLKHCFHMAISLHPRLSTTILWRESKLFALYLWAYPNRIIFKANNTILRKLCENIDRFIV